MSFTGMASVLLCCMCYFVIILISAFGIAKPQKHRLRRNYIAILVFWGISIVSCIVNIAIAVRFMSTSLCGFPSYWDANFVYGTAFGLVCASLSLSVIGIMLFIFFPWEKRKSETDVIGTGKEEEIEEEVDMGTLE